MIENRMLCVLALGLGLVAGPSILAQEPSESGGEETAVPALEPEPSEPVPVEQAPKRRYFGLYLGVGWGGASADALNVSVNTTARLRSMGSIDIDEMDHGRAAIGWRFPEGKGDLRLLYNGYRETSFSLRSIGERTSVLNTNKGSPTDCISADAGVPCFLVWNDLTIKNGVLSANSYTPSWDPNVNDTDNDGSADESEIVLGPPTALPGSISADSLNNQVSSIDILYGREFGTRRVSSHWWAGLRRTEYEGNTLHAAWLNATGSSGFPTGSGIPPIVALHQELTGIGPSGAWEVDVNFLEKRLILYGIAQATFSINSSDLDSGEFFTLVDGPDGSLNSVPARLQESRQKSTWQDRLEFGVRARLVDGLWFEGGLSRTGFLDAVLVPSNFAIPENSNQVDRGVTALYSTQDLVFDAWHASIAYQF